MKLPNARPPTAARVAATAFMSRRAYRSFLRESGRRLSGGELEPRLDHVRLGTETGDAFDPRVVGHRLVVLDLDVVGVDRPELDLVVLHRDRTVRRVDEDCGLVGRLEIVLQVDRALTRVLV